MPIAHSRPLSASTKTKALDELFPKYV